MTDGMSYLEGSVIRVHSSITSLRCAPTWMDSNESNNPDNQGKNEQMMALEPVIPTNDGIRPGYLDGNETITTSGCLFCPHDAAVYQQLQDRLSQTWVLATK